MLTIIVPGPEVFDEETQEFSTIDDVELTLEHSLVSISKWESIYQKPFLGKDTKSTEEVVGYIKAMLVDPKIPPEVFSRINDDNITDINAYVDSKMSATWFSEIGQGPPNREIVTSELIYYWMITFNIPIQCENWHLNRLLTLIRVCNVKNSKPKKLSAAEIAARNRELNERRKQDHKTTG